MGISVKKGGGARRGDIAYGQSTTSMDGWEDFGGSFDRRVVHMDIRGETGTGRTRLALTAPGPIALVHAAEKIDGLTQPFIRGNGDADTATWGPKVIRGFNFAGIDVGDASNEEAVGAVVAPVWNKVVELWRGARNDWARTCIMDTGGDGWELIRLARFGTNNPKGNRMDRLYGPVNAEWRSMFKPFKSQSRCNCITIHQVKDEYVDKMKDGKLTSVKTGRRVMAGMKEMSYIPDVIIETGRDPIMGTFTATIVKGWAWAEKEGTTFRSPVPPGEDNAGEDEITFANIMAFLTDTQKEEWLTP